MSRLPMWRRYRRLFGSDVRADVDDELRYHLDMRAQELIDRGTPPESARAEALRAFGDLQAVSAECVTLGEAHDRERDRREWLGELRQDVTYAVRQLLREPAFTAIAVLTLALGIGATTAIFSAVRSVVLRPFPFAHPERVMMVSELWPGNNGSVSDGNFVDWRARQTTFEKLSAEQFAEFTLADRSSADRLSGGKVTKDFFAVFGVGPALGRTFRPEEDEPGNDGVVVLSDALWRTRFGAAAGVVGREVQLNGRPYTVIGVMPSAFDPTTTGEQLWVPQAFTPEREANHDQHHNIVVGRLKPGVPASRAQAELTAIQKELDARYPNANFDGTVGVRPFDEAVIGDYRERLFVTLGAVAFVLLIACGNVANLLLARGASRAKELAVRAALGARRGRIVRQLLTESVVLGLAAAVAGLGLAYAGIEVLVAAAPEGIPRLNETRVDVVVLTFTVAVALASSVVFGLVPSLRASKQDVQSTLREGGRGSGAVKDRVRQALVAAEVALACTLLAGAGLLVRSAIYLQQVKPGFDPAGVVTARVTLPEVQYKDPARALQAFHAVAERLAALPGVKLASLGSTAPLVGGDFTNGIVPEGQPADQEHLVQAASRFVMPGYLATMRIPLVRGRDFTTADVAGAQRVAIVSEALAKRAWPNQDPIGRRFGCCDGAPGDPRWKTVVGVVGDVHADGPAAEVQPEFYIPLDQMPAAAWDWTRRTVTVVARAYGEDRARVAGVAAAIRAAVRSVDPAIPVYRVRPMRELIRGSTAEARFNTLLLGLLATAGLVLAMVGIYGVVGYFVAQRATEMGLRMALGASPADVLRLLTLQGARPILVGVGVGAAMAVVATRLLRTAVVGVRPSDPVSLAAAAAVLCVAGLAATLVPARRATRRDPAQTLMRS
ncbi:permease [Gemmatirosa kalamazoonensis]|uniref:Permease n=1 Tax=Gemmatirosa kalamazoonensis TaxID=861299 RepID=W0RIN7_9BACT|nr:ABC transporter permease [Gemmatirosa kalamazoonensis]AHG89258.1 permease [Gemmatirosa kalamazoonensis]